MFQGPIIPESITGPVAIYDPVSPLVVSLSGLQLGYWVYCYMIYRSFFLILIVIKAVILPIRTFNNFNDQAQKWGRHSCFCLLGFVFCVAGVYTITFVPSFIHSMYDLKENLLLERNCRKWIQNSKLWDLATDWFGYRIGPSHVSDFIVGKVRRAWGEGGKLYIDEQPGCTRFVAACDRKRRFPKSLTALT